VEAALLRSTVYFDGSCALCRAEIGYYRRNDHAGALCFIDVSQTGAALPDGVSQWRAMERLHVRVENAQVLSGAAAFVALWAQLPGWRWAARAAALPLALAALELGYRLFLPVRPRISRAFGKIQQLRAGGLEQSAGDWTP
jgi:predicted DCC family thiol-disulfide oxidoreductase YuxK